MPAPDAKASRDVAVIDVGSNSVRLVIYRLEGRAIWTVFNEKVLAGLGRGVEATGRLAPEAVAMAMTALRRFKAVLDAADPAAIYTAATAAVREAADGPEFIARVERELGLTLQVISGENEARLSALGVLAGWPRAEGVVGDLGGSSLELIRVKDGRPGKGISLPLGPFSIGASKGFDAAAVRALVNERLDGVAQAYRTKSFHAVGGGWRSLALIHMEMTNYPLRIVHLYEMTAREALDVARFISKQSKGSLERIRGARKRADTLAFSAVVVEELVERLGIERLWISAYGIREGLLFDDMTAAERASDPLLEGCAALGARQGISEGLGRALAQWLQPGFATLPDLFGDRDSLLIEAACRLADAGARLHPDHRADLAFTQVLRAPIAGQTHVERAFLAVAIHARYGGPAETPEPEAVAWLLSRDRWERARALGLAMRLGADLSGRSPALLAQSVLDLKKTRLVLTARAEWADMLLGEQTGKRAQALANALGLELDMRAAEDGKKRA